MHQTFFGWNVPLVHTNRGARSALRLAAEHHTLLQDVTWRMQPILIGSSDIKALIALLYRICPTFLKVESHNAILSGSCFGEGVLHEPDRFPMGAIGPAMWWICRHPLDSLSTAIKSEMWCVHIFVHPAIRTCVHDMLAGLVNETPLLGGLRDMQGGLACFQLRGRDVTNTITRALGPIVSSTDKEHATNCGYDWDKTRTVDALHTRIPHLTAVSVRVSLGEMRSFHASDIRTTNVGCQSYMDAYRVSIQQWDLATNPGRSPRIGEQNVIFISHCQGDPFLSQNAAVCGWDILCHPSDANDIFHALAEKGEACIIGLVEEAHARMESEPPLPVFPRDYPDTVSGQHYWDNGQSDWSLLRRCLGHGHGRVPVVQLGQKNADTTVPTVSWNRITTLPENAELGGTATKPVVVRGEFGMPFLTALAGCGHIPFNTAREADRGERKRRRPRRRVRPPSISVPMHKLSNKEADAHSDSCETLLRSLSLPALIFCHVKIEGKGTMTTCRRIYASMDDAEEPGYFDFLLGEIVAGSFSTSRGCVHGVGFVGAARLLHVLSSDNGRLSGVAVARPDGTRCAELKVTCGGRVATMSLLL